MWFYRKGDMLAKTKFPCFIKAVFRIRIRWAFRIQIRNLTIGKSDKITTLFQISDPDTSKSNPDRKHSYTITNDITPLYHE